MTAAHKGRKSETRFGGATFLADGLENNSCNILLKYHHSARYRQKSQSILIPFYNTAGCRVTPIRTGNKQE